MKLVRARAYTVPALARREIGYMGEAPEPRSLSKKRASVVPSRHNLLAGTGFLFSVAHSLPGIPLVAAELRLADEEIGRSFVMHRTRVSLRQRDTQVSPLSCFLR